MKQRSIESGATTAGPIEWRGQQEVEMLRAAIGRGWRDSAAASGDGRRGHAAATAGLAKLKQQQVEMKGAAARGEVAEANVLMLILGQVS